MFHTGKTVLVLLFICINLFPVRTLSQDYRFVTFKTEKELSQPYVYSILQDLNGYLWIGTGNGLSKYDGFAFKNHTVNDSLADNFITCGLSMETICGSAI